MSFSLGHGAAAAGVVENAMDRRQLPF